MTISTLPMGGSAVPSTVPVASTSRRESAGYDFGSALAAATREHSAQREPVGRRDDRAGRGVVGDRGAAGGRAAAGDRGIAGDRAGRSGQPGTADRLGKSGQPGRSAGGAGRGDGLGGVAAGPTDDAVATSSTAAVTGLADETDSAPTATATSVEIVPPTVSVATVVQSAAQLLLAPDAAAMAALGAGAAASTAGDLPTEDAATGEAPSTQATVPGTPATTDAALLGRPAATTSTGAVPGAITATEGVARTQSPIAAENAGEGALSVRVTGRGVGAAAVADGPVPAKEDASASSATMQVAASATSAGTAPTAAPNATPVNAAAAVVPTQATGSQPAAAVPTTAAAPAPVVVPSVAEQIGVRLASLRSAPLGEHIMTMRVDPESMGPIRVVAHIAPDGIRIELLGGTDHAREALRAALPDLRRDLAATGLQANLDLADLSRQNGKGGESDKDRPGSRTDVPTQVNRETVAINPATVPGRPGGLDLVL